jgi:hypothetical protein
MSNPSWQTTKEFVHSRAGGCCEYCRTCEINVGQALHIEHINPAGGDHSDNLCLACPNCNLSKASAISAFDADTGEEALLFNPRSQIWDEHFEWQEDYTLIQGLTPVGRVTVDRFKMNRPRIVLTRRRWAQAGLHPGGTR